MISLMLNEFKKIFSKKSTYIIFVILIIIILFFSILDKYTEEFFNSFYYQEFQGTEQEIERRIKKIEDAEFKGLQNTPEEWIQLNLELDRLRLSNRIDEKENEEWKKDYLVSDMVAIDTKTTMLEIELEAKKNNDKTLLKSKEYLNLKDKYKEETDKFIEMTEKEFTDEIINKINERIEGYNKEIKDLKKQEKEFEGINNGNLILQTEKLIEEEKFNLEIAEMRKEKKIPYGYNNYMSNALRDYQFSKPELERVGELKEDTPENNKREYYYILTTFKEAEYILRTEQDIKNMQSGNYAVRTFLSTSLLSYIVFVIVISGTIVSEEYSKGTIKNLLVKPYRRSTILLSKLIVVLIMVLLLFLILFAAKVLISGIMFDFKTMDEPVVQFNVKTMQIEKYNLFYYVFREFVCILPYILVFVLFTFAISTITTSSAAAITLGMVSFIATDIVNSILLSVTTKSWIKYIPTIYWDLRHFIEPEYTAYTIDFNLSIIVIILTYLVFIIPAFIVFKRKDIKNI